MLDNQIVLDFTDITSEESATVTGGVTTANFDVNSYLFVIGAGAVFNGGITTNVVNIAFQQSLFTSTAIADTGSETVNVA